MTSTNPLVGPSALRDVINPQFHQNNFPAESYSKTELGLKLDKGMHFKKFALVEETNV
jgi:cleavage and polyadenylation specificity factor subunit 4